MANPRAFLALFLAPVLLGSAVTASAAKDVRSQPAANGSIVTDHIPQFDGPLTLVTGADGRSWATWTYRAAGEFDIAVSSREASSTAWSAPIFFGRRSGSDEIEPTVAVDSQGATYVAFATTNPSRVAVAMLAAGLNTWSGPVIVSGAEAASSPALLLVGDRLIVAYRTVRALEWLIFRRSGAETTPMESMTAPMGSIPSVRRIGLLWVALSRPRSSMVARPADGWPKPETKKRAVKT